MTTDVATVFLQTDEHAESIKHNPSGQSQAPITAIVERDSDFEIIPTDDGEDKIRRATIYVANTVTIVDVRVDTFEINGDAKRWTIHDGNISDVGGMLRIELVRSEPPETSMEEYRKPIE
jgi:hypothetical protein